MERLNNIAKKGLPIVAAILLASATGITTANAQNSCRNKAEDQKCCCEKGQKHKQEQKECCKLNGSNKKQMLNEQLLKDGLIDVTTLDPSIEVHLVYATPYNFMGRVLYENLDRAYLIPEAAAKLKKAAELLRAKRPDLHLVIYDAARPLSIQKQMWKLVEGTDKEDFVADPSKKGMHNFGAAVDLTLADCTGHPVDMGGEYDYFGDASRVDKEEQLLKEGIITQKELNYRLLLREIMTEAGFLIEPSEWWHFNTFTSKETRERFKVIE